MSFAFPQVFSFSFFNETVWKKKKKGKERPTWNRNGSCKVGNVQNEKGLNNEQKFS